MIKASPSFAGLGLVYFDDIGDHGPGQHVGGSAMPEPDNAAST